VTGWVTEQGKVTGLDVLSAGPARVVVRVRKSLNGDYQTDKIYAFYPRHFEVDFAANKPDLLPSRAYYAMSGQFEDNGGTRAMVDGQGNDEGVSGKAPNPQWYAIYSDVWAHSCVALGGLDNICYWDCPGAWGGTSFTTGMVKGVRMAYVFHPGQKDAGFAQRDYQRLSAPVSVR
jgi:hypothetical protein